MDHHATPAASVGTATCRFPAGPLDALDAADAAFRLLTAGPRPLAVHASRLAAGLPDRPVPLDELRVLLLHPSTTARARNRVWAELVRRARAGDPAWVIGLTGIALPGLRRAVASAVLDAAAAGQSSAGAIERALSPRHPPALVRPVVLHLLWTGRLRADLTCPLSAETLVRPREAMT